MSAYFFICDYNFYWEHYFQENKLNMTRQTRAASLSVLSNITLLILKTAVGILTGSIGVLSAAADSLNDLLASIIAFFSVRASGQPADVEHPYGHGKIENVSTAAQALLIFTAAVYIIYEAVNKIVYPKPIESPVAGMIVMVITAVLDLFVSRYLLRVARETDSSAIRADAYHLTTDVWTAAGVFAALFLVYVTGIRLFDPIVALIVAAVIIRVAILLTLEAAGVLIDMRLPESELQLLEDIVMKTPGVVGYHKLRTRKSGPYREIDFHLIVPANISVNEAHDLAEKVENTMRQCLPNTTVVSHIEPDTAAEIKEQGTELRRTPTPRRTRRSRRPRT